MGAVGCSSDNHAIPANPAPAYAPSSVWDNREQSSPCVGGTRSAAPRQAGTRTGRHRSSGPPPRSEEHTSELQSLMRISYAVFCLKKKTKIIINTKPPSVLH